MYRFFDDHLDTNTNSFSLNHLSFGMSIKFDLKLKKKKLCYVCFQRRNLFLADSVTTPNPSATKTKKRRRKAIPETRAEDSDGGGADKRSSGLAREPGMPKRPHNAFFYYSQDKRPRYKRVWS